MDDLKLLKALKNKILSLAMQGKLVKQDENDEPASILLEKIKKEKAELLKQGKLKKEKELPPISADEVPYELPKSWKCVRLGEVFFIERGSSPRPISQYLTNDINGINWIKIGDATKGSKYITQTKEKITIEGAAHSRFVEIGNFIFSNSMSFGRPYILKINGCIHDGWNVLRPIYIKINNSIISINQDFIYYAIISSLLQNQIKFEANGGIVENIKSDKLKQVVFPLPPLAEQERIVAKIEEIFAIIDEIEKNITENNKISQILYNRFLAHAMQGKLVKQDENDEPASVLLEKIKKEKELPPIKADEVPYELPKSWQWVRLGDICYNISTRPYQINISAVKKQGLYKVISQGENFIEGYSDEENKLFKIQSPVVLFGDHTRNVKYITFDFIIGADGTKLLCPYSIYSKFFYYLIEYASQTIPNKGYARHFSLLSQFIYPLPPLAEQERIVAKIEEIKEIIDEIG